MLHACARRSLVLALLTVALAASGCAPPAAQSHVVKIAPSADSYKVAQTALINARPGDVIEFAAGTYNWNAPLSLDVDGVTVRGQGHDKTIFSFTGQQQGTGGEGVLVTSKERVTLEDFAVEDTTGDGIKVSGCKGVTMRRLRVGWTAGPQETNGGYGLYPVLCTDVLIEDCVANDATDAGIYLGQSDNAIVRRNLVEHNVAGIEIENSQHVDVYENRASDNTGGILVFALPDLERKSGSHCRVFKNKVIDNNRPNFSKPGNIVHQVPFGSGIMILAHDHVDVFDNLIEFNQCFGVGIFSYQVTLLSNQDAEFDPYSEAIHVHDNQFQGNGDKPNGQLGTVVGRLLGGKLPAIVYDGMIDPKKAVDGKLPDELAIRIQNNGDADFVNFDFRALFTMSPKPVRDLAPFAGELPPLEPVKIEGVK